MEALSLSNKQIAFLAEHGIVFDFDHMSEDDFADLEQALGDLLVLKGLDLNYDDNEIGRQAREIMDLLADE